MCVLSNNSPKEIGIYKAIKNAPDHVVKILSVLEETIKEFYVTVMIRRNSTRITIQDKKTTDQKEPLRVISLEIFMKPKSYLMSLYHQTNGTKNSEFVYEIKVKGNYELTKLKINMEKLLRGKNLINRPTFYPF